VLRKGSDIAIVSLGSRLAEALSAAEKLETLGFSVTVADARFAKPVDETLILDLASRHDLMITIEEGSGGGFGSAVLTLLSDEGLLDHGLKVRSLRLPDTFIEQDKPDRMIAEAGLDAEGILRCALQAYGTQPLARPIPRGERHDRKTGVGS
jgi:1-deoxy-D-xylulose-5-phosphate synthase